MIHKLYNEILAAIEQAADGRTPEIERRYHKHDQYVSYGLKTTVFRELMKCLHDRIMELSLQDRLILAEKLMETHIGEPADVGIFILDYSVKELTPVHFPIIDRITEHFRSWSQVDGLCIYVLQPMLEAYPVETLRQLEAWNRSVNRWKRRSSVVVFVRKIGKSGRYTNEALRLCENLIWDNEDIVLKGVGWALKDVMRGERERVLGYVKDLRRRGVSSVVTLYAIRDLKGEERKTVLGIGKS